MLKQRVITALLLVAVLLPALLVSASWPFAALSLLFIAAAAWEWSRLNGWSGAPAIAFGAVVALVAVAAAQALGLDPWRATPPPGPSGEHVHVMGQALAGFLVPARWWWLGLVVWVLGGWWVLRHGVKRWSALPLSLRAVLGAFLLVLTWLGLLEAKGQGLNLLLSMFCLVWAADIGAYFGGRAFGRRKLAVSISPGKSWEGVWSGMVAVLLLALLWITVDRHVAVDSPSLYGFLFNGLGPVGLVVALIFLTGMSVVGDLFESLVKRQAGVKDSSQLLPGHGGVLDRVDALLPMSPLSLALLSLCQV